jgi:hypothetical protein
VHLKVWKNTDLAFIVTNIFNKDHVMVNTDVAGSGLNYPATVRPLFDTVGRVFRVSLEARF